MKKTIIALMALAGVALAETTDATFTSKPSTSAVTGYEAFGFAFTLSGTAWSTSATPSTEHLPELVTLSSISYTTRQGSGDAKTGIHYIVITDEDSKIVGWSTNAPTETDVFIKGSQENVDPFIWTFGTSITLNTSDTYYAVAIDDITGLTPSSTLTSTGTYMQFGTNSVADFGTNGLNFTDSTKGKTGLMFLDVDSNDSYVLKTGTTQHAPYVTIVTKAIPEPTTATLSLLALCGLAARRRRK